MPEFIKAAEVIGDVLKVGQRIGQTILGPFKPGWGDIGKSVDPEPTPANITMYESEDHIIRGEE